ncbi:MAG TPA: glycoside hydrolase family 15 protein [Acidimicrobiales bacterium]|jgi:GH15 family glucan-1,4-alpha-glucosidase|nr:glycoside hydrolase family 15 protein [Acidimicrobiales bacterium]
MAVLPLPIEDYAVIGDLHTAAIVGRDGSIDWLCLPHFSSGACFARLLGTEDNGFWKIAPAGPEGTVTATRRSYRPGTLVLETEMDTADGTIRITDCMPIRETYPQVVRMVEGVRGTVPVRMDLSIRFDYGESIPWVSRSGPLLTATAGPDSVALWTRMDVHGEGLTSVSEVTIHEGQQLPYILTWFPSHEAPPRPSDPWFTIATTEAWWEAWSSTCTYQGDYADAVLRSLITLKALTYEPTGGIVAAATTSLPESLGGNRNWDYRYCWLRDATLTLESLMRGGFHAEAMAWRDWLLRATAGDPSKLQIMYGTAGERRLDEWEVGWLPGYEGSAPVRIGNAAADQYQLDVYGEVMSALYSAGQMDGVHSRAIWDLQSKLIEFIEDGWKLPDDGIWEVRGPRRHFTHSKVMAWVAVDRAVRTMEDWPDLPGPIDKWRALRDEIHAEVCEKGFNTEKQAFTQYYGCDQLDASILMMPLVGFLPAKDPRVVSTVEAIQRELLDDAGFVLRYRTADTGAVDGLTGREGAFLACSFWLADCLHMIGKVDEAKAMFERLLALRNDLGLLAEEYDAVAGRQVGNFPQAFSHVSLVNTACRLTGQEPLSPGQAQVANRVRKLVTENLIGAVGTGNVRAAKWGLGGLVRHGLGNQHYVRPPSAAAGLVAAVGDPGDHTEDGADGPVPTAPATEGIMNGTTRRST